MDDTMNTTGSYTLSHLVKSIEYKPGWYFTTCKYGGSWAPLTLRIDVKTTDSGTGKPTIISHSFTFPAYFEHHSFKSEEVVRWLFDCVLQVERHEAGEFFALLGSKPFYPEHGPGSDPYRLRYTDSCVNPTVTKSAPQPTTVALDPLITPPSISTAVSVGTNG